MDLSGECMKITQVITDTLQEMDPADADIFAANAEDYLGKLENLDQEFRDVVNGADLDLIVMADKFPLRYFADTYGLRYRLRFPAAPPTLSQVQRPCIPDRQGAGGTDPGGLLPGTLQPPVGGDHQRGDRCEAAVISLLS